MKKSSRGIDEKLTPLQQVFESVRSSALKTAAPDIFKKTKFISAIRHSYRLNGIAGRVFSAPKDE